MKSEIANEMNLTAAELRREYGKALAYIARQATENADLRAERDTLKAALQRIVDMHELPEAEYREKYNDHASASLYMPLEDGIARAALAACVPPQETEQ